jgi:hypothetical protein
MLWSKRICPKKGMSPKDHRADRVAECGFVETVAK